MAKKEKSLGAKVLSGVEGSRETNSHVLITEAQGNVPGLQARNPL